MPKLKSILGFICCALVFSSCYDDWFLQDIPNEISFENRLSDYMIFKEPMNRLEPYENVFKYDLNSSLFTDYASKVRFIKLPDGGVIKIDGADNLEFPEGTILVKSFYYPGASLPEERSGRILETRLLILKEGKWNVGVYKWNETQTEAFYIENGSADGITVGMPDGSHKRFTYKIPTKVECTTCHSENSRITPIGPKISNLNKMVVKNGTSVQQLEEWIQKGYLQDFDRNRIKTLPQWDNPITPIRDRGRAYLDLNCAHCHNPSGVASQWSLDLRYTTPYGQTGINSKKYHLLDRMKSNWQDERMPKIGTVLKHKEGIELVQKYVQQLSGQSKVNQVESKDDHK